MKRIAMLTSGVFALGYANGAGRAETVLVKGDNGPVRVNKADFDADQEGDKNYTRDTKAEQAEAKGGSSDVNVTGNGEDGEVKTTAAPSAPDFSSPDGDGKLPIDETKNAVAPAATTPDQLLVMKVKEGKGKGKYTIVDGMGQKLSDDRVKLLKLDDNLFDTEAAAKQAQSTTEPKPAPTK